MSYGCSRRSLLAPRLTFCLRAELAYRFSARFPLEGDISILRRGRVVAQLDPVSSGRGADVKALLRRRRDPGFRRDIESVRSLLEIETRS